MRCYALLCAAKLKQAIVILCIQAGVAVLLFVCRHGNACVYGPRPYLSQWTLRSQWHACTTPALQPTIPMFVTWLHRRGVMQSVPALPIHWHRKATSSYKGGRQSELVRALERPVQLGRAECVVARWRGWTRAWAEVGALKGTLWLIAILSQGRQKIIVTPLPLRAH